MKRVVQKPEDIKDLTTVVFMAAGVEREALVTRGAEDGRLRVSTTYGLLEVPLEDYVATLAYEEEFMVWADSQKVTYDRSLNRAWLAGRESVLSPQGKGLAQQLAVSVLRGNEADIHVLADWLAEQGRLDDAVATHIDELKMLLAQTLAWVPPKGQLAAKIRGLLGADVLVDAADFVSVWQSSETITQAAGRLNIPRVVAVAQAAEYRDRGMDLKRLTG